MPTLDLRAMPIGVINVPHQERRRNHATKALSAAGMNFTFIDGIRDDPRHRGCSKSHLKAIETLRGNGPFLVLEDDAVPTADFTPVTHVPNDATLLYLGHSPYGYDVTGAYSAVPEVTELMAGTGLLRVHSMLAAHAIVYLNDEMCTRVADSIRASISAEPPERHDIGLCRIQAETAVLAVAKPYFVQSAALQGANKRERRAAEENYVARPFQVGDRLLSRKGVELHLSRMANGGLRFAPAPAA